MKKRTDLPLVLHTLLATVAVAAAYVSWSEPALLEQRAGTLSSIADHGTLKTLVWRDKEHQVELTRESKSVRVSVRALGPADAPVHTYPGTALASALLERLRGLPAVRRLGTLTDAQKTMFGLEPPRATLSLGDAQATQEVRIGEPVYGGADVYAQNQQQEAFIIRGGNISNLMHGAITLQDRELFGVRRETIDAATLRAGLIERHVRQQQRTSGSKAYFATEEHPERRLEQLTAFIERALRLRVTEPAKIALPAEPALELVLHGEGGADDVVARVGLYATPEGPVAQSNRFGSPMAVQRLAAETLLADLEGTLSDGR